ncbi:MAG: hypothetical protein KA714_10735 [Limnoraphis sp. WC205]|jgi:hypothetical protein|nr:hypothetical protein [Limnoraphis sp. WC205]
MAELSMAQWAAGTTDTNVSGVLSGITLPDGLTSAEFLYKAMKAYRAAQETYNAANPNDVISSMSLPSTGGVAPSTNGELEFLTSYTFTVRVPVSLDAATTA